MYVHLGYNVRRKPVQNFRTLLALSKGDQLYVWELPPGYDWSMPVRWAVKDVVMGRHTLTLPEDMEAGTWDLRLALFTDAGVLPAAVPAAQPKLAHGEAVWEGVVTVVSQQDAIALAHTGAEEVVRLAEAGDCDGAEAAMQRSRHHLPPRHPEQHAYRADLVEPLARCWATLAEETQGIEAIVRARQLDHHHPRVRTVGGALADAWANEAEELVADNNIGDAYQALRKALLADPRRSHLRRQAEELRDQRLGLNQPEATSAVGTP